MDERARTEAQDRARQYLRQRGTEVAAPVIRERVGAAFAALDALLDTVSAEAAGRRALAGEWTVHEVVDHLVETHRPGVDELRCLLAGRRPPGHPIPASLQSMAPDLRPWPWLRRELTRVHGDILDLLGQVPAGYATAARAPLVMVINVPAPGGGFEPLSWVEDLDWKAYAITWRLHALDHLNQAKKMLAAAA